MSRLYKSSSYIYIKYIWFVNILLITFLNEPKLILFLHTVKWFPVLLCITNNSIKYYSFVHTQLNEKTVLLIAIQFNAFHLFAHSLNIEQFYLSYRLDPIRCNHSEPGSDSSEEAPTFLKAPRLEPHNQTQDTFWWVVLPLSRNAVGVFYSPNQMGSCIISYLKSYNSVPVNDYY